MTRNEPNGLKKWTVTLFGATSLKSRPFQTHIGEPCWIYETKSMTWTLLNKEFVIKDEQSFYEPETNKTKATWKLAISNRNRHHSRWGKPFSTPGQSRRRTSCSKQPKRRETSNKSAARCRRYHTKSWRWRDLQREAEQGLEEINARRIIEIVDENLVNARVTPFDKRKKIRRTRKSDYWKLQKSYGKVNNITDVTQYQCNDITEIKHLTYAFTLTSNAKLHKSCYLNDKMKSMKRDQNWILQLEHNIKQLRKNISQVEQINTINASQKIWRNTGNIRKKFDIQNKNTRKNTPEKLKQKLLANNNRLKQYKKGKTDTIKMETL